MIIINFIIKTLIDPYLMILLLRIWIKLVNYNYYDPFSQYIIKLTEPVINNNKIFSNKKQSEIISIILIVMISIIKFLVLTEIIIPIQKINIFYLLILVSILNIIKIYGQLLFLIILIRSFFSFININNHWIYILIDKLIEPIIYSINRVLPNMYGLDLSNMIIISIIYLINYIGLYFFPVIWTIL